MSPLRREYLADVQPPSRENLTRIHPNLSSFVEALSAGDQRHAVSRGSQEPLILIPHPTPPPHKVLLEQAQKLLWLVEMNLPWRVGEETS